jgi:hypothetical protein
VEEPMLSMFATRRREVRRSGSMLSTTRHSPLNSSIDAIKRSVSLEGWKRGGSMGWQLNYLHFHPFSPIYSPDFIGFRVEMWRLAVGQ